MIARTNTGGGGAFAVIDVSYPEGAVCTCTNGLRTMRAKNTSGRWMFRIPRAGEWTVTAAQGSDSKSETVEVEDSKAYLVHISFGLYYFNYGPKDGYTWAASNMPRIKAGNQLGRAPTVTAQEDGSVSIFIAGQGGSYLAASGCYLLSNVSLESISTLEIGIEKEASQPIETYLSVIPTNADAWGTDRDWGGDSLAQATLSNGTSALNVLSLNGTYHIAVGIQAGGTNSGSFILKYLKAIEQE